MSNLPSAVEVLVVGGGPAGLATAAAAAAGGREVALVHADAEFGRPVRTSGGAWLCEVQALGLPPGLYRVVDRLLLAGPTQRSTVRFGAERPIVLDVTATYQHLADLASAGGAWLYSGHRLTATHTTPHGFRCQVGTAAVDCRWVIDATGYRRTVLQALGYAPAWWRFGVGAEVECEDEGSEFDGALLFVGRRWAPTGYGWAFPTSAGRLRLGIGLQRPDSTTPPSVLLRDFLASSAPAELGLRPGAITARHGGVVPSAGLADACRWGRAVGVGDAIGQVRPLVGDGIVASIEAGRELGAALATTEAEAAIDDWWQTWRARHAAAYARGLAGNHRLSTMSDERWDESIRRIGWLRGPAVATLLRGQLGTTQLAKLALTNPVGILRYAASKAASLRRREP